MISNVINVDIHRHIGPILDTVGLNSYRKFHYKYGFYGIINCEIRTARATVKSPEACQPPLFEAESYIVIDAQIGCHFKY